MCYSEKRIALRTSKEVLFLKTAVYEINKYHINVYLIALNNIMSLTDPKCKPLRDRNVLLFQLKISC